MTSKSAHEKANASAAKVLGRDAFAAISAVEGLSLSEDSKRRLEKLWRSTLSPDQRRAEVIKKYLSRK